MFESSVVQWDPLVCAGARLANFIPSELFVEDGAGRVGSRAFVAVSSGGFVGGLRSSEEMLLDISSRSRFSNVSMRSM